MRFGYAVIWRGSKSTMFYDGKAWTFDPIAARIFGTWWGARWAVGFTKGGIEIAQAWTDD